MILAYDAFFLPPRTIDLDTAAWDTQSGASSFVVVSDGIKPIGPTSNCTQIFRNGSYPNDQYAKLKIVSIAGSTPGNGGGVCVRGLIGARTGYYAYASQDLTGGDDTALEKRVAGVPTTLSTSRAGWINGDTISLEAVGSTLTVKRNGVTVDSIVDTDITSGSPGVAYAGTITIFVGTNFEAGNFIDTNFYRNKLASDNFQRGDSTGLGSNWGSVTGLTLPNVRTNQASGPLAQPNGARYNAINWPRNQYSQIQLTGSLPIISNDGPGVMVRSLASEETCYAYQLSGKSPVVDSNSGSLKKFSNGTPTNLAGFNPGAPGDILRLEIFINTISCYRNGTLIFAVTDTDLIDGDVGVFSESASSFTFDNWEGGGEIIFQHIQPPAIMKRNRITVY